MKVQVVSDLHLEFGDVIITNAGARVLVLSGDIITAKYLESQNGLLYNRYNEFFTRVSAEFEYVIYVAGNHEFYSSKWFKALDLLKEFCSKFDNVYFLENSIKQVDEVTFIGSTLWTDMNKQDPVTLHYVRDAMTDFRSIVNDYNGFIKLKPIDTVFRHTKSVEFIKNTINSHGLGKFVVVGHHAPSFASIHEHYRNDFHMNGAYASDLSNLILDNPQIKLWTHGHMHSPFDYMIGDTRVVCNPRGYAGYDRNAMTWTGAEAVIEI